MTKLGRNAINNVGNLDVEHYKKKLTNLQNEDELPSSETLHWADGFLLVYSITDRQSFNYVRKVKEVLDCFDTPLTLVGNKGDMVHLRQVSTDEGKMEKINKRY